VIQCLATYLATTTNAGFEVKLLIKYISSPKVTRHGNVILKKTGKNNKSLSINNRQQKPGIASEM
jgi:hypothetical protein